MQDHHRWPAGRATDELEFPAEAFQRHGDVLEVRHGPVVDALPKTRSGKILRKTMRQIADGEDYVVPSTIEDAGVIDQLIGTLRPADGRSGQPIAP